MTQANQSTDVRVLVVDDEKEVADAYALRLRGFCDVETAYDGEAALATIEESTIDVVLLDRHMPGLSGDDVLAELDDRDFRGRVVMVTAVDPDFDVLELPFDDYLCKPVDREDVRAAVDQQRRVLAYDLLGEYFSAQSKRAIIEAETTAAARDDHDGYRAVAERADTLRERVGRLLVDDDVIDAFDDIGREEL
ncbi:response regulator [Halobacterium yunchengense]|uniref:response regulator n=1 Tax=Halobacterium yunchengense TaxID=3108497 RepID=UPI003008A7EE